MTERIVPDIRIVRLVITIFKTPLRHYFSDPLNWELGLRYQGVNAEVKRFFGNRSQLDHDDAVAWLNALYVNDPPIFPLFLEYMLNDFVRISLDRDSLGWIANLLSQIKNELLSLGYRYDLKKRKLVSTTSSEQLKYPIEQELDLLLGNLDANLVSMRQGAWEVFGSESPDALRQSMSSARELLRQSLEKLSPGESKKRKERVKDILKSESESALVEALCEVIDQLYGLSSKEEHTQPSRESVLFALRTVENILYLLLTSLRSEY